MSRFEYKVVPAPKKGQRAKGVKGTEGRFAHALESVMNELGAQGWEYLRTDTLPAEERAGLTSRTTTFQNMLVFRRALDEAAPADAPVEPVGAAPAPVVDEDPNVDDSADDTALPVSGTPDDTTQHTPREIAAQ